jgi:polysaccharide chain length determinant protein (PEP-CTERM system associated)
MDALIEQARSMLRAMWRHRWYGVLAAWVVAFVGMAVVARVPDRFEAEARVYVDTKSVLRPLMRDLAVEPDLDQTIALLGRTLITRPNVEKLIGKAKLLPADAPALDRDRAIDGLMRDIRLTGSGRDNVFTFSIRDANPQRAQEIVATLVALFVESDLGAKQRDVESARKFIEEQIRQYEARLAEAENRLKEFKLRNLGTLDTPGRDFFARINTLTEEVNKLTTDLRAAEQSRDALKKEMSGEEATILPEYGPAQAGTVTPELDARLDAQRRQLDEHLRRYTDAHPDVVATRRLIARLEEQRQQEIDSKKKAAESVRAPRAGVATNPVFQQIKLALAEAEATVAGLRVRLSETQGRLNQLRSAASRVPQVDAELAQLNRDYEIVRRQYEAMAAQREKAALSEDVDATRLAQFRIIDPPRVGKQPVFPNRRTMSMAVLFVALAVGAAVALAVAQIFPTLDSAATLRKLTQRPVLGSVSMLVNPLSVSRARRQNLAFGGAVAGLFVAFGAWLALASILAART